VSETSAIEQFRTPAQRAKLVELGPAPRPERGGVPDVFAYQVEPMDKILRAQPSLVRGLLWVFLFVGTLGLGVLLHGLTRIKKARRLAPLFEYGTACEGEVIAVLTPGGWFAHIVYAFTVAGARHTGQMQYPASLRDVWRPGDAVTVLYDPANPSDHIGLFR
jgi:hypothetical protein